MTDGRTLEARILVVHGMVIQLEGCAQRDRNAGRVAWAERFERLVAELTELKVDLETALRRAPVRSTGQEGADAAQS